MAILLNLMTKWFSLKFNTGKGILYYSTSRCRQDIKDSIYLKSLT